MIKVTLGRPLCNIPFDKKKYLTALRTSTSMF